jgi:GntR family transcriptional repressor for pyruvate dehydrogenase complex
MSTQAQVSRRGSVAEDVADQLLASIKSGVYSPGDRLPTEPELAQSMGVGRTTLREGISKLRMLGVIEVRRGLGTYVRQTSDSDPRFAFGKWSAEHQYELTDLFEVRSTLEGKAAALAASRITDEQSVALQDAAAAHLAAMSAGDVEELVRTDELFHQALIAGCNNEVFRRIYADLVPQFADYRRRCFVIPGAADRSCRDHSAILEEVLTRNPEGARAAALSHIDGLHRETLRAGMAVGLLP